MLTLTRATLRAAVATIGTAFALATTATAEADTNKSVQDTSTICDLATALPGHGHDCGSDQTSDQAMTKHDTTNVSVIDYFGAR